MPPGPTGPVASWPLSRPRGPSYCRSSPGALPDAFEPTLMIWLGPVVPLTETASGSAKLAGGADRHASICLWRTGRLAKWPVR